MCSRILANGAIDTKGETKCYSAFNSFLFNCKDHQNKTESAIWLNGMCNKSTNPCKKGLGRSLDTSQLDTAG